MNTGQPRVEWAPVAPLGLPFTPLCHCHGRDTPLYHCYGWGTPLCHCCGQGTPPLAVSQPRHPPIGTAAAGTPHLWQCHDQGTPPLAVLWPGHPASVLLWLEHPSLAVRQPGHPTLVLPGHPPLDSATAGAPCFGAARASPLVLPRPGHPVWNCCARGDWTRSQQLSCLAGSGSSPGALPLAAGCCPNTGLFCLGGHPLL